MRIQILGSAAVAVGLLAAPPTLANGRFPASNQIVFSPTDENIIVGRATYAALPSSDNGKSWGYLCEDTLALPGASSYQDPEFGLTATNALIAGLYSPTVGLDVSNDLGCNWSCVGGPLAGQQVADIVVRPDPQPDGSVPAPGAGSHQVLALTGTYSTSFDAGTYSQVFESTDDGASWAALGTPIDPQVVVTTLDVAASDPSRIYVSGTRGYSTSRTASLFISADNGMTWTEHRVPQFNQAIPCLDTPSTQCPSEDALFIAAVDPGDPNQVYLRSNGLANTDTPGYSRLYVTKDGGNTFTVPQTFTLPSAQSTDFIVIGEMLGFALSPDGSKVFTGTKESGLWSASSTDLMFTNVNPKVQVQCLASRQTHSGPELWACSNEISGFIFGKSTDDGVTFTPMMATVTSMAGPIACSGGGHTSDACLTDANASACSCSAYESFCSITEPINACLGCGQEGAPPPADDAGDGGNAGGGGAGGSKVSSRSASCGCAVVGGGGAAGLFVGCTIAAIALRRRRTR